MRVRHIHLVGASSILAAFATLTFAGVARSVPDDGATPRKQVKIYIESFDRPLERWIAIDGPVVRLDRRHSRIGASARVTAERASNPGLQYPGFGGLVSGHRVVVSAWVKGGRGAVGRYARIQLNEIGGGPVGPLGGTAVHRVRLNGRWQRVAATGVVSENGTVAVPIIVLERARRGVTFWVDNYRVTGDPGSLYPGVSVISRLVRNKSSAAQTAVVWILTFAAGVAAVRLRRRLLALGGRDRSNRQTPGETPSATERR